MKVKFKHPHCAPHPPPHHCVTSAHSCVLRQETRFSVDAAVSMNAAFVTQLIYMRRHWTGWKRRTGPLFRTRGRDTMKEWTQTHRGGRRGREGYHMRKGSKEKERRTQGKKDTKEGETLKRGREEKK